MGSVTMLQVPMFTGRRGFLGRAVSMMPRIAASGRGGDRAPKNRVEPGREYSVNFTLPTQYPEAPLYLRRIGIDAC